MNYRTNITLRRQFVPSISKTAFHKNVTLKPHTTSDVQRRTDFHWICAKTQFSASLYSRNFSTERVKQTKVATRPLEHYLLRGWKDYEISLKKHRTQLGNIRWREHSAISLPIEDLTTLRNKDNAISTQINEEMQKILNNLNQLENIYTYEFKHEKLKLVLKRKIEILKILSKTNPELQEQMVTAVEKLARAAETQENWREAQIVLHRLLKYLRKRYKGEVHPKIAETHNRMGYAAWKQENYATALGYFQKALAVQQALIMNGDMLQELERAQTCCSIGMLRHQDAISTKRTPASRKSVEAMKQFNGILLTRFRRAREYFELAFQHATIFLENAKDMPDKEIRRAKGIKLNALMLLHDLCVDSKDYISAKEFAEQAIEFITSDEELKQETTQIERLTAAITQLKEVIKDLPTFNSIVDIDSSAPKPSGSVDEVHEVDEMDDMLYEEEEGFYNFGDIDVEEEEEFGSRRRRRTRRSRRDELEEEEIEVPVMKNPENIFAALFQEAKGEHKKSKSRKNL